MRLLAIVEEDSLDHLNNNNNNNDNNDDNNNNVRKMFAINLAGDLITIQVHNSFFLSMQLKKMFHDEKVNFIPLHLKDIFVNGNLIHSVILICLYIIPFYIIPFWLFLHQFKKCYT